MKFVNLKEGRNYTLDVIRAISCVLVILIHRPFPGVVGGIIKAIARSGVAFFFLVSGFYFFHPERQYGVLIKRLRKLISTLGAALLFFLIWEFALRFVGSGIKSATSWFLCDVLSVRTWYYSLVWDKDPLAGHLWFLFALIRCNILAYILIKFFPKTHKYIPFIIWCIMFYLEYSNISILYYRNGWLYGLSFFLVGYQIAARKDYYIIILPPSRCIYTAFVGLVMTILEFFYFGEEQLYLGTILLSIGCFLIGIKKETKGTPLMFLLIRLGAYYSSLVYILHWAVKEVFIKIDKEFAFTKMTWYGWISPLLVIFISIIVSGFLFEFWIIFSSRIRIYKENRIKNNAT